MTLEMVDQPPLAWWMLVRYLGWDEWSQEWVTGPEQLLPVKRAPQMGTPTGGIVPLAFAMGVYGNWPRDAIHFTALGLPG